MSKLCLVALHGFLGSGADWQGLTEFMRGRYRVLAPDLPGHGAAANRSHSNLLSIEYCASYLEQYLNDCEAGHCALAGYSMGGRLALYFALTRPRRVAALMLESASPGLESHSERAARRHADEERARLLESRGIEAFVESWEKLPLFKTQLGLDEEASLRQRRGRLAGDAAGLAACLRGMGSGVQPWLGGRLPELSMPVLLIAGAADEKFRAIAASMAASIPTAQLRIVRGAGHNVHLEQPEQFYALLAGFLDGCTPGRQPCGASSGGLE